MILVGTLMLKMLSKNVIHFFTYCLELKFFSFFKIENSFTTLNCSSVMEDKLQKRAAGAILDVDFTVPSLTMFTQLKRMTFPEQVVYHKAIQMRCS